MTYRDSYAPRYDPWTGGFTMVCTHSWEQDLRQRLTWLYGDPDERLASSTGDRKLWERLGRNGLNR